MALRLSRLMRRAKSPAWSAAALSATGGRATNQDRARAEVLGRHNLWGCEALAAVADGMGGHRDGAAASATAVATVWEVLAAPASHQREFGAAWLSLSPAAIVARAIRLANGRIHAPVGEHADALPGGTTLTVAAVIGREVFVGHVGDSRLYVADGGDLHQVTRDHTFVAEAVAAGTLSPAEARLSPFAGQLTRGVGLHPEVVPDVLTLPVREDMTLLLTSDGLTGVLEDEDLAAIVRSAREPRQMVQRLLAEAERRQPSDNLSAAVLRCVGDPSRGTT